MCGRYTLRYKPQEIQKRFEVDPLDLVSKPRYNIAPSQIVPAIRQTDKREMFECKWGLIPYWAKDPSIGNRMINAKSETLAEKPSFRRAFSKRRCLIPADGFYEWQKKGKEPSQPIFIKLKDDGLFGFAGLWEEWKSPEDEIITTCTIITIEPNELISNYHHRMAVIIKPEDEATWLDPGNDIPDVANLLQPYPSELMEAYPVSRAVNSPRTDGPECIAPLEA